MRTSNEKQRGIRSWESTGGACTRYVEVSFYSLVLVFKRLVNHLLCEMLLSVAGCIGSVSGKLTLEPPTGYFCADVNVTYTCHDDQVDLMSWSAKPYFTENDILYSPGLIYVNNESVVFCKNFTSSLMTIVYNSDNIEVANITTTLTVITRGLGNGTNITCLTNRRLNRSQSFSLLYFAGI